MIVTPDHEAKWKIRKNGKGSVTTQNNSMVIKSVWTEIVSIHANCESTVKIKEKQKPSIICLRTNLLESSVQLHLEWTALYSSGRPGIGNCPAKASTSTLISATRCWNFSPWDNAWTNAFRVALGSRLFCTSTVSSMPAEEWKAWVIYILFVRNLFTPIPPLKK